MKDVRPLILACCALASAGVVATASYLARGWLAPLMFIWIALLLGGVVMFQNRVYRAVALGSLVGLSVTLAYVIWLEPGAH